MQGEKKVETFGNSKQPGTLVRLWDFSNISINDLFRERKTVFEPRKHLDAAIQWLKRAQDCSPDDGISWGYSLKGGWRLSYRETTGYIADTFFDLAYEIQDDDAWNRAVSACKWLVRIQNDDGSISDPRYGSKGIVFDTGQVLQGLLRAYEETQDLYFLQAAEAAGNWLVKVADETGRWTQNTHLNVPHVYNTRVAWPLLKLHVISPHPDRERVARANLDWAVSQQQAGWFDQCAFQPGVPPFTHNIAYANRGLLEAGYLLNEPKYIDAAIAGARAVLKHVRANGFIPGQIDLQGKPHGNYCCLTGNCQMAIIWLKLFQQTGQQEYYQAAFNSLQYVMSCQDIQTSNPNIRGGLKVPSQFGGHTLAYPIQTGQRSFS